MELTPLDTVVIRDVNVRIGGRRRRKDASLLEALLDTTPASNWVFYLASEPGGGTCLAGSLNWGGPASKGYRGAPKVSLEWSKPFESAKAEGKLDCGQPTGWSRYEK